MSMNEFFIGVRVYRHNFKSFQAAESSRPFVSRVSEPEGDEMRR